jgi:putative FmdB family regulatory protein
MPTYDYKCTKCNYTFEVFQRMSEEPLKSCPKCKGKVKRLIGMGAGPIFKGSGFYHTDYKNKPAGTVKKNIPTKNETKPESGKNVTIPDIKKDK